MAASSSNRFASLDEHQFNQLLEEKDSENTRKSTKRSVGLFRAYLVEKNIPADFESLDKVALGKILSKFYIEARKPDGDFYKTNSLCSICAGLNRHLKNCVYHEAGIDIIHDKEFNSANVFYKAATVQLMKIGKGNVVHHPAMDENDIARLYASNVFDQDSPSGLQWKVWFELMIYICRRGRENLKNLKKGHFVVKTDSDGRQFVSQAVDELTKKVLEDNMSSRIDAGRMYKTRNVQSCPVKSFKKYIAVLNLECDALFQTPKSVAPESGPWFKKSPVGKNTTGNFMCQMSKMADLSKVYTNHCLRATCISILDRTGFAAREICQVSGHQNEGSITSYTGQVNDNRKQNISNALSHALGKIPTPSSQQHHQRYQYHQHQQQSA